MAERPTTPANAISAVNCTGANGTLMTGQAGMMVFIVGSDGTIIQTFQGIAITINALAGTWSVSFNITVAGTYTLVVVHWNGSNQAEAHTSVFTCTAVIDTAKV
jgi:hypothetical protein